MQLGAGGKAALKAVDRAAGAAILQACRPAIGVENSVMEKHSGKRPFVTCHVFASIDGRIEGVIHVRSGAVWGRLACMWRCRRVSAPMRRAYGPVTTKGFVGAGHPHAHAGTNVPEGDYVAAGAADAASYYVSLDSAGEIAWPSGTFRRAGRPHVHVIELLTEETPAAYRAYLCERGASYVVAGAHELDVALACEEACRVVRHQAFAGVRRRHCRPVVFGCWCAGRAKCRIRTGCNR